MAAYEPQYNGSLVELPVEIIEHILSDLTLKDIRNLRLVCRGVKVKASGGRFKSYCSTKDVDLRIYTLRQMAALMIPGSVACELRDLTITGVVYVTMTQEKIIRLKTKPADPTDVLANRQDRMGNVVATKPTRVPASDEDIALAMAELEMLEPWQRAAAIERSRGDDVQALTELFERIRQHTTLGKLHSITLNITVMRYSKQRFAPEYGGAPRPIWDAAAHTFLATLQALATAELTVDHLDVYGGLRACSVSVFDIANILQHLACVRNLSGALDRMLDKIKSLSISTSAPAQAVTRHAQLQATDPDNIDRELHDESRKGPRPILPYYGHVIPANEVHAMRADSRNYTGLASLLQRMPRLEILTLHETNLVGDCEESGLNRCSRNFHTIANTCNFTRLKKLTFRGIGLDADDLLSVLRDNPEMESVNFRKIDLRGHWQPIFDHFSSAAHKFRHLQFDSLFELTAETRMVLLGFPDGPHGPYTDTYFAGPAHCVAGSLCVEDRESVLAGVDYRIIEHWNIGCLQRCLWAHQQLRDYGPPRTR